MNSFDESKSVFMYAKGTAIFDVYFPDGKADCRHCQYCSYNEPFKLFKCKLTSDYIETADINRRHPNCPISFEETQF